MLPCYSDGAAMIVTSAYQYFVGFNHYHLSVSLDREKIISQNKILAMPLDQTIKSMSRPI